MAKGNILCHERLSIVGVNSGAQPLTNEDASVILSVNGEIYNHVSLRKKLLRPHKIQTESDCEIILHLYEEYGADLLQMIDGMFSFILYDVKKDFYLVARDHVGITTMYQGWRDSDKSVWFASEMKSLHSDCDRIVAFPPGCFYTSESKVATPYYSPKWYGDIKADVPSIEDESKTLTDAQEQEMYLAIRTSLEKSVKVLR
jgi:asparagine synthase (glutamine-hydrolysing)